MENNNYGAIFMDDNSKYNDMRDRVVKLETYREADRKDIEKLLDMLPVLAKKMDSIGDQIKRAQWVLYGVLTTLGVLWMIGLDALKIAQFFQ